MFKKVMLGTLMSVTLLGGSVFADSGRGANIAGTIGNSSIGGQGRDVLLGGAGTDYLSVAVNLLIAGVDYLVVG
jgi:Ca2+-binding RTX toxin-like protein